MSGCFSLGSVAIGVTGAAGAADGGAPHDDAAPASAMTTATDRLVRRTIGG
jgi:hypothetical protein